MELWVKIIIALSAVLIGLLLFAQYGSIGTKIPDSGVASLAAIQEKKPEQKQETRAESMLPTFVLQEDKYMGLQLE